MRKSTKSAVAITLAIAGAIASSFSSNAADIDLINGFSLSSKDVIIPARIELKGRVVKVSDGDTITILDAGNNQNKIRLNGIDAPEKSQAFDQKSRECDIVLVSHSENSLE